METTARIQRKTAEVLLALAQRDGNETGIQRLKGVDDTLRALTALDGQLALLDGPNGCVLAEPLTARELTVLRLLRGTLTRREIAQELCVSANTIKSHVRAVYQKLDAPAERQLRGRGQLSQHDRAVLDGRVDHVIAVGHGWCPRSGAR